MLSKQRGAKSTTKSKQTKLVSKLPTTKSIRPKKRTLTQTKRTHAGCAMTSSTETVAESPETDATPQIRATLSKDPVQRFAARNEFMRKRHTEKDHLIHTHHNDLRLFACNLTQTLRLAVEKHKMSKVEAEVWGGYAAGTALYAGLLRGNDRVIMESFTLNPTTEETNHVYVEAFAVGEIRGFSSIKAPVTLPDGHQHPGEGVVRLTKAIHQHKRKFQSTLRATGDPMQDWQHIYSQSEQIPTYVQTETILREDENGQVIVDFCGASLVQVLGGEAQPQEKARILAEKKLKRDEDENDDHYVKRVQLFEYQQRAVDIDLQDVTQKYGSAGYLTKLLGIEPEGLGRPENIKNIGNVENEFDWEIFERSLLQSALRDKPLANVVAKDGGEVTESGLQKDGKFQYQFEYRPLQFFCRCYQTDAQAKLTSLPRDLLVSLAEDEVVTFTCDFCAAEDEITRAQVQSAIAEKDENEKRLLEQQAQEAQNPDLQKAIGTEGQALEGLADKNAATQH